jgi:hypothetical protein
MAELKTLQGILALIDVVLRAIQTIEKIDNSRLIS